MMMLKIGAASLFTFFVFIPLCIADEVRETSETVGKNFCKRVFAVKGEGFKDHFLKEVENVSEDIFPISKESISELAIESYEIAGDEGVSIFVDTLCYEEKGLAHK